MVYRVRVLVSDAIDGFGPDRLIVATPAWYREILTALPLGALIQGQLV